MLLVQPHLQFLSNCLRSYWSLFFVSAVNEWHWHLSSSTFLRQLPSLGFSAALAMMFLCWASFFRERRLNAVPVDSVLWLRKIASALYKTLTTAVVYTLEVHNKSSFHVNHNPGHRLVCLYDCRCSIINESCSWSSCHGWTFREFC